MKEEEDKFTERFLVTDEGDGYDTVLEADQILIVPIETLDEERRESLEHGNYEKFFKHGAEFPAIYLSEIFEMLDRDGRLEELLSACRLTRLRLDGKEMPTDEEE